MKIHNLQSLYFGKTLYGKCNVRRGRSYLPCKIYRLDERKDINYFEEMKNHYEWKDNNYIKFVEADLPFAIRSPETNVFVMEDKNSNCLAYSEITNFHNNISLDVLEVNPKYTNEKSNSKITYIGETFLAFLACFAIKTNKDKIESLAEDSAYDFYTKKCFFSPKNETDDMNVVLSKRQFYKLISKNKKHTNNNFLV